MADLVKQYGTDPELEAAGAWVDVDSSDAPADARAALKILPDDHPAVVAAIDEHHRTYAQFYSRPGKRPPADVKLAGEIRVAAAAIADWKNIDRGDEKRIPATTANKTWLVKEVRFIREQVILLSGRTETFRRELVADMGNGSAPTSPA